MKSSIKHSKVQIKFGNSTSRTIELKVELIQGLFTYSIYSDIRENVSRDNIRRDENMILNETCIRIFAYADDNKSYQVQKYLEWLNRTTD